MSPLSPDLAIAEALTLLRGIPLFMAGSCVAAQEYDVPDFGDVDMFAPTPLALVSSVQRMLDRGYTIDSRHERVWYRWLSQDMNKFKTNSIKLESLQGVEYNVIYKTIGGHPLRSLSQVLEGFDFGLLGLGYDVETGLRRDFRDALFPNHQPGQPYGLMPDKWAGWEHGFFGSYNGLREPQRYAKFVHRGHDMSVVQGQLVTGYRASVLYHANHDDDEKKLRALVYAKIADLIEDNDVDQILAASKVIDFHDPLDVIMEALEHD